MATREQNEKRFKNWIALPNGGRRYWTDRAGAVNGFQRMVKIVAKDETTLQLIQEVYDDDGELIERHQKYPADTGHQRLTDTEE
jgi:hypothetical protein